MAAFDGLLSGLGKIVYGDREGQVRDLLKRDPYGMQGTLGRLKATAMARPEDTLSGQLLAQGLARNVAAQNSLAVGAPASQQAMARRMAMQQAGRMGGELAGQQALAALLERQKANEALANMQMGMRDQDLGLWKQQRGEISAAEQGVDIASRLSSLLGFMG